MDEKVSPFAIGATIDKTIGRPIMVCMSPHQVIEHFGGQSAAARALGVRQPSIAGWLSSDAVPWDRQLQIERITGGALKHNPADVPEHLRETISPAPSQEAAA